MKIFIGSLMVILGIVGILMQAVGNLPFEIPPAVDTLLTVIGIIVLGLGWQDELDGGKSSIIDLVKKFFSSNPFRMLGLNVLLALANNIIDSGLFSGGVVIAAQIFLAIAAVFGFVAGYVSYRIKLYQTRSI